MTYTPYLIANYATGLENRLQPWLLPDDAQEELLDGFVYRGVLSKRSGYEYFATGNRGGYPYTESRVVAFVDDAAVAVGDGTTGPYVFILPNAPVRRGSVSITDGSQTAVDDGLGGFIPPASGTINYTTGAVSITFGVAVPLATPITADFSYFRDEPVMGIMTFITATNTKELLVATTTRINLYNAILNILEDITITPYSGTKFNFWSWVNYKDGLNNVRLIFTNNKDEVQYYAPAIVPIIGDYVSYPGFAMDSDAAIPVPVTSLLALQAFQFKDRLILLRTTENGTVKPQRIRISGTGASSDDFTTAATGAGFIDIPDGTWIKGASFNRDDLIIFTEASPWTLKYTGNDTTPFVLDKIDESRGCDAAFSVITYLNRTSAASPRGLIITDGYRVERQDETIPDFSFNEIDGQNFELCFAGVVDDDRDHYLLYPASNQVGNVVSTRILTTNYDEDNYSIYRLPLSCMGTFITPFGITWNDLLIYNNWAEFAADYGNWNSFAFNAGSPFSLGGGHHGEVWRLNVTGLEDNPVKIRNITIVDAFTIEVTTDWNNYSDHPDDDEFEADAIFITGVSGMLEVNNHQYNIIGPVSSHNVFRLNIPEGTANFSAFNTDTIGEAIRVIPFTALFKKFNPYVNSDKKVRCGWLYMYVDSTDTNLRRNVAISAITQANPAVITTLIDHGFNTGDQVSIFGVVGMTELNGNQYFITVIDDISFSLNGVDSTGFTAYVSGGYATVAEDAKLIIDIITNDTNHNTQLNNANPNPYQGNCTNLTIDDGSKKWYKVYINQVGKFIQFRVRNRQAGTKINIQATMPGFAPVGRLI